MTIGHIGLRWRPAQHGTTALHPATAPLSVDALLATATRQARETAPTAPAVTWAFTWDEHDQHDEAWYPQGIATSADVGPASTAATGGRDVVVASWYAHHHLARRGARLTFVDLATLRYAHVLLVRPVRTPVGPVLLPVPIHAGGIAWYGPYLYVAATRGGVHVFDVRTLARVSSRLATVGPVRSTGIDAVLPRCGRLHAWGHDDASRLRYSFLSIGFDAAGEWLVGGEYGAADSTQRLVRYPLDPQTSLPVADRRGRSTPDTLAVQQSARMQGVTFLDDVWYVTTSQGRGNPGDLLVGRPDALRRHRTVLPTGPEDITTWRERRELWSLTEWPGARLVYRMDADAWVGTPD